MRRTESRYQSGQDGESIAERYLTDRGMVCLARRFRGGDGQIDLIMQDGDVIAFVQVKNRPSSLPGSGFNAITPTKQRRILHAAQTYIYLEGLTDCQLRFDALEITSGGVRYIPNAFQPGQFR